MLQNISASVQGSQKQSLPAVISEISVVPTSLSGVVASPTGFLSETQQSTEQKQPKQLSVTGSTGSSIVDSSMQ